MRDSVCPFPFSLAANRGIIIYFLFLPVLRCFNSRRRSSFRNKLRFAFGDLGVKSCMHLTRAYRSLPRPSSKFKPSYPSNSFLLIRIFSSFTLYIYLPPKREMSISEFLILFSLNINWCKPVILKLPKRARSSRFIVSFFRSYSASSFLKLR